MGATRGTLILLRTLAERPMTQRQLLDLLEDSGLGRDERTLRRWLAALRDAGFDILRRDGRYELRGSPVRISFTGYETLATLSLLESLAAREPVYGDNLASAARKLREALPEDALEFADSGRIEFDLDSASDPPEDPQVIDTLRHATHQSRRVEILYHSLQSDTVRWRLVEPVRIYYAQRAHRLDAYEHEEGRVTEFRINRVRTAEMLPEKFAPESHRHSLDTARVRLSAKAFTALGKSVIPDAAATIELLEDGGAIIAGTTPSVFWTVRDLAALGPEAEVLGGPKLKDAFLAFLNETSAKYS
jgi:predicted DNA-binding transcriptional regulator YafY